MLRLPPSDMHLHLSIPSCLWRADPRLSLSRLNSIPIHALSLTDPACLETPCHFFFCGGLYHRCWACIKLLLPAFGKGTGTHWATVTSIQAPRHLNSGDHGDRARASSGMAVNNRGAGAWLRLNILIYVASQGPNLHPLIQVQARSLRRLRGY